MPAHADGISQVEQLEELEATFAHNILLYVDLDSLARPLQMRKTRLAHQSERNNAPGHAQFSLPCLQLRSGRLAVFSNQRRWRIRPTKFARKHVEAQRLDLLEFLLALLKLIARLKLQLGIPFRGNAAEYSGPRPSGATIRRSCRVPVL